jgi:hypothetical protein
VFGIIAWTCGYKLHLSRILMEEDVVTLPYLLAGLVPKRHLSLNWITCDDDLPTANRAMPVIGRKTRPQSRLRLPK